MNKISVIVPVYNVEHYLVKCLDSIINQTYKDIEIILVDDGSTDNSPSICDEYEKKDKRVRVLHKMNEGQSSARNRGLDIATGEFIAFVDSDDYLDLSMFQCLIDVIQYYDADVAVSDLYELKDNKLETSSGNTNNVKIIESRSDVFFHLIEPYPTLRFEVWNKLFKRTVIGDVRFKERHIYEELNFDRNIFVKSNKLAHIDRPLYYYRVNRPGSTNSFFKDSRFIYFEEMENYITLFENDRDERLTKIYVMNALETCLTFYNNAVKLNASKEQKERLVSQYHNYIVRFSSLLDPLPLKYKVFKFSPDCYNVISRLYRVLRFAR